MKVLVLARALSMPPTNGTASRLAALLPRLARRHRVAVVAEGDERALRAAGLGAEWFLEPPRRTTSSPSLLDRLDRFPGALAGPELAGKLAGAVREFQPDVVLVANSPLMRLLAGAPAGVPIVLAEGIWADYLADRVRTAKGARDRFLWWIAWLRWQREEIAHWRRARRLIAVSEIDAERMRSLFPAAVVDVVPNGVEVGAAPSGARDDSRSGALFVGSTWYPNVDGANRLIQEIAPRVWRELADFRFHVAGKVCSSSQLVVTTDRRIVRHGFVDDLEPLYRSAAMVVAPLRLGHGTRVKILEAMIAGAAVVSTAKGAEGLDLVPGTHLLEAESDAAFADAIVRLARDPALASRLAAAGNAHVRATYGWDAIAERLVESLVRACSNPADVTGAAAAGVGR